MRTSTRRGAAIPLILSLLCAIVAAFPVRAQSQLEEIEDRQQAIFAALELTRSSGDLVLAADAEIAEDWDSTWVTTSLEDAIHVELFFFAPVDLDGEDVIDEFERTDQLSILSSLVESNVVLGIGLAKLETTSSQVAYASVLACSTDGPSSSRLHWVVFLELLDSEDAEEARETFYQIDFEATGTSPCFSLNRTDLNFQDPDFVSCNNLAVTNFECRRNKGKAGAAICVVTGIAGVVVCYAIPTNPLCLVLIGVTWACDACSIYEIYAMLSDIKAARACCCNSLACRTDGGTSCPSTEGCNSSGCPGNPCLP